MTSVDQQRHSRFELSRESGEGLERRRTSSDAEIATRILHRAVGHLLWERERGEYLDLALNEAAVELLCEAAQEVARSDRRQSVRSHTLDWLRSVMRSDKR